MSIRYLPEQLTASLVSHELAMQATLRAFIAVTDSDSTSFPVVHGHGHDRLNRFSLKSASTPQLAGVKVGSYWPRNGDIGLAAHSSCILMFDQRVGRIEAVIEAAEANAYRTAAGNALAVDVLARADARRLAIFGAGHQAAYECAAVMRVRRLEEIYVVNRDVERAYQFARKLAGGGVPVAVVGAEEACRNADIIVTATGARSPLFEAGAVQPGTHVSCMGADAVGKQELPSDLLCRAALFCDEVEQSLRIGEFQHVANAVRSGAISAPTNLGQVLTGRHPRRTDDISISVFDSSGLALQDLFLGQSLLDEAEQRGLILTYEERQRDLGSPDRA